LKRNFLKACGMAVAGLLLQGCGGGGSGGTGEGGGAGGGSAGGSAAGSLLQLVQQDARFTSLLAAARKAGLEPALGDSSASLTLFAPDNSAFDALSARIGLGDSAGLIAALSSQQLQDVLGFHILPQRRSFADLDAFAVNSERPATLYSYRGDPARLIFVDQNGQFNVWDGIGRSSITLMRTDVPAGNGVLHEVSDVLVPRGVLTLSQMLRASIDAFSTFSASMTQAVIDELDGPGPYTVFAPANGAATPPLSATAVRHHVVPVLLDSDGFLLPGSPAEVTVTPLTGQSVTVRRGTGAVNDPVLATLSYGTSVQAFMTDTDFFATNGVYHTIDRVLP
jgi:uncharacterized surface protein with fasciclin (FAS1) repeats